jgi:hypothetical protein
MIAFFMEVLRCMNLALKLPLFDKAKGRSRKYQETDAMFSAHAVGEKFLLLVKRNTQKRPRSSHDLARSITVAFLPYPITPASAGA